MPPPVCENIINLALENGFSVEGLDYSPIKGPEGNIEYLIYIKKCEEPFVDISVNAELTVKSSHGELDK